MTSDTFLRLLDADYHDLQRKYKARGFSGESHDMVCLRMAQTWRLISGAEPVISRFDLLPTHMRYVPYQ